MTNDDIGEPSFVIRPSSFENSTWLPAALLATLVLLVSALQAFGGEPTQLQWRPAFAPAKQRTVAHRPAARQRAPRQQDSRGYAVIQVAYEDDGGWSTSPTEPQGAARMDTLVVHPRDPQFAGTGPAFRVAQDPFENDTLDDELGRDIELPFGDQPVAEELPEMDSGELPEPVEPQLPEGIDDDFGDDFEDNGPLFDNDPMEEPDFGSDLPDPGTDNLTQPGGRDTGEYIPLPGGRSSAGERSTATRGPTDMAKFNRERQLASESCEAELERARASRISTIDLGIRVAGTEGWDYPFECTIDDGAPYASRQWPEVTYMWKAAANCHKPLYFEQHHLERYGHSWGPCVQPLISGAHFFTRLPVLPYCMGLTPPNECIYPLGYYRPGNCAPYMIDPIPFSWRAALFQAGATVGTAAILP